MSKAGRQPRDRAKPAARRKVRGGRVPAPAPRHRGAAFPVVGVGASAGGLQAFKQLLERIPADSGMAFVLIQHLDPNHRSLLGQALSSSTKMPVADAADRTLVQPNCVYVIPENADISIREGRLLLATR